MRKDTTLKANLEEPFIIIIEETDQPVPDFIYYIHTRKLGVLIANLDHIKLRLIWHPLTDMLI